MMIMIIKYKFLKSDNMLNKGLSENIVLFTSAFTREYYSIESKYTFLLCKNPLNCYTNMRTKNYWNLDLLSCNDIFFCVTQKFYVLIYHHNSCVFLNSPTWRTWSHIFHTDKVSLLNVLTWNLWKPVSFGLYLIRN